MSDSKQFIKRCPKMTLFSYWVKKCWFYSLSRCSLDLHSSNSWQILKAEDRSSLLVQCSSQYNEPAILYLQQKVTTWQVHAVVHKRIRLLESWVCTFCLLLHPILAKSTGYHPTKREPLHHGRWAGVENKSEIPLVSGKNFDLSCTNKSNVIIISIKSLSDSRKHLDYPNALFTDIITIWSRTYSTKSCVSYR